MAVYKIFPNKDATLYSRYAYRNSGRDEILEVSAKNSLDYLRANATGQIEKSPYFNYDFSYIASNEQYNNAPNEDIRRAILSFSDSDINIIKSFSSSSFQANLRLYLAFAQNLSLDYTILCMPLSQSWDMGTGKFNDTPETQNGVGWQYTGQAEYSPAWSSAYGTMEYLYATGGGSWNNNYISSQSFQYTSDKDPYLNITSIVNGWFSASLPNYGLILKHTSSIELSTTSYIDLKFFSMDTHTIYPPCIDFKWDDSTYNAVTASISTINHSNFIIACENNRGTYKENTVYTFRFKAKDRYPTRIFTTSSIYLNWKYLSSSSYWAVQDYKTKEYIIDFDASYTKLSADADGNYFKMYLSGLQPERYYKLLVKTILPSQETIIVDNDIIFKVIR